MPSNTNEAPCALPTTANWHELRLRCLRRLAGFKGSEADAALLELAHGAAVAVPADVLRDAERLNAIERLQGHITYGKSMKYGEGWYVYIPEQRPDSDYPSTTLREAIDAAIQQQDRTQKEDK